MKLGIGAVSWFYQLMNRNIVHLQISCGRLYWSSILTSRGSYMFEFIIKRIQNKLPKISSTEQEALDAGTVWWDGELFSGKPDWQKLLKMPAPQLTPAERQFMNGPVEELCRMIDAWQINFQLKDLPPELWQFLKENNFFALMIPKQYGGLEFSALAHSEILAKIGGKCATVASTVSVPNSLGPAELLLHYGTQQQKDQYLPNLACGKEIPCFALTAPEAGSDATAIIDHGTVCYRNFQGKNTLGILLNWNKRYITLAPIATVMGLAFKLFDPQQLLKKGTNIGITCALIPTDVPGITIGDRHWPLTTMFQNGPTQGKDVFIPVDWIIGGPEMAGKGWTMLVESLSCGRAISLPSVTAGKAKVLAAATGAYARIRKQFNLPICKFEGIEEPLARMAANVYICNATRRITAASIDNGAKPTVPGAISKLHVTERSRQVCIDAMDVHGGKAIMQGPKNYVAEGYLSAPIAITVEGANILTRCLIIFGQGAIRCHPYIMREMQALQDPNLTQAARKFTKLLFGHAWYSIRNIFRSFFGYIFHGAIFCSPVANKSARYFRQVTWGSAAFAVLADTSLILIGGKLKYKEKLSARLGDLLSLLYLASVTLKRFQDEGAHDEDLNLLQWCMQDLMATFWQTVADILANFPNRIVAFLLRIFIMPFGVPMNKPDDNLGHLVAEILTQPNATRDRLIEDSYLSANDLNPAGQLEIALKQVLAAEQLEKTLAKASRDGIITALDPFEQIQQALQLNLINSTEASILENAAKARAEAVAVDYFAAKNFASQAEAILNK
jgi:acyl-CoA dehydrogenase